jgi:glycosyltransferase involved in cell wall biosynthesis
VRFVGARTDVPACLAASDIHCQPNLKPEPFGIAYIEALYAGLPVVTTKLGGALEILGSAPESSGVLVEPDNAHALAEALKGLILNSDRREGYRLIGPRRARELCDPAERLSQLYRLLGRLAR